MINKKCLICNKEFQCRPCLINKRKYCSHQCYWKAMIGIIPKNAFPKGHKPWNINKKWSKEAKEKMSKSHKGKFCREQHPNWKGGETKATNGYIWIKCSDHPLADKRGYVRRIKLVFEKQMNRQIYPEEAIHHINFDKSDDRPENLFIFENTGEHTRFHHLIKYNPFLKTWLKSNIT